MVEELIEAGLKPHDRVLEIGCGCGRIAGPLLDRLTRGFYDGLDVDSHAVAWCRENIQSLNPRFRFHHADVRNPFFNPKGSLSPLAHRLDGLEPKDFIVLILVFPHLPPHVVLHYLKELRALTRQTPNARVFISLLLFKSRTPELGAQEGFLPCRRDDGVFYFEQSHYVFAFNEAEFLRWCRSAGFEPAGPVKYLRHGPRLIDSEAIVLLR